MFNTSPTKIPARFLGKLILKFVGEGTGPKTATTILTKNKRGGIDVPSIKVYLTVTAIKTVAEGQARVS